VRSSEGLRAGELLIAVGSPVGVEGAVTCGVVHSAGRFGPPGADEWVQADVWLAPGNSGGPLADVHGRVVGINTLVALGLGLAIPSEVVQRFVRHATAGAEAA
jgi:serine protease Do